MFAEDTKIFREIKTLGDASSLQEDLGKLATWSQSSGLLFNEAKCEAQHITRKIGHRLETSGGARLIGFVKYWMPVGSTWRQNGLPSSRRELRRQRSCSKEAKIYKNQSRDCQN